MKSKEISEKIEQACTLILEEAKIWLSTCKSKVKLSNPKDLRKRQKQLETLSTENTKLNIAPKICNELNLNSDFIIKILEI